MIQHKKEPYKDKSGYLRSNLAHRNIAYETIYKKNRAKYPLPFKFYIVHHIDRNKENNAPENLQIMTKFEHDFLHGRTNEEILKSILIPEPEKVEKIIIQKKEPEPSAELMHKLKKIEEHKIGADVTFKRTYWGR
ncbi:MAG: HNH endonuclease [archaeon]